ncbi:MAG: hypothetical protein ACXACF_06800 [Candidatus Hermodarchaeia archaeon]
MKQKNSLQGIGGTNRTVLGLVFFLSLILLISGLSSSALALSNQSLDNQILTYQLEVHTSYDNVNSSFYGTQQLTLNTISNFSIQGQISWNLTWDNGNTWYFENTTYVYSTNRTYQYAGLTCYTAWWIHPAIQIGDKIPIDGDVPATNNFLRLTPFTVTDLLSHEVNHQYFLCWQLSYDSPNNQHETYYYEYQTGILLSATSVRFEANQPVHEVWLELQTAEQPPPPIPPLLHFWTNYNTTIIAFIGATLVTFFVYYVLQRFRPQLTSFPPS